MCKLADSLRSRRTVGRSFILLLCFRFGTNGHKLTLVLVSFVVNWFDCAHVTGKVSGEGLAGSDGLSSLGEIGLLTGRIIRKRQSLTSCLIALSLFKSACR